MFEHQGMNVAEVLRWVGGGAAELRHRIVLDENPPDREEVLGRAKGVLILAAHVGNFELMALYAAARFPLTIITKEIKHPGLNAYWAELRATTGLRTIAARNSYRACFRVLRDNEWLGFVLDQNMIRKEGIFVTFFGQLACTTPGLAMLSAHSRAPVVPIFMVRLDDGRHEVKILPFIEPPAERTAEAIAKATQRYTDVIESVVRAHPEQWIWMHRRWRTQPAPSRQSGGARPMPDASPARR
jgi:KDO2-lipid IV(A) lauroyltransferase